MNFGYDVEQEKIVLDTQRQMCLSLREEQNSLQSRLEMFDNALFENFRVKVLVPEMDRLAKLRMTIPSDQIMTHERVMGQWAEAGALATQKETLAEEIKMGAIRLREEVEKLQKMETKFEHELKRKSGG